MRRTIALMTVLSLIATGLGCKHIAGKSDCQYHPSDAIPPGPSTPYVAMPIATVPTSPVVPATPVPATKTAPMLVPPAAR